ncbi:hypothetical protein RYA05_05370 [Pseudomonas syringae pv. actinidiae]|mgnify:FL=1|nr:hypothetical protein [Pseudomonas syringae pv. actinidiae]
MQIMTKHQYNLNAIVMSIVGVISLSAGIYMLMSPKHEVDPISIKREKFTICQSAASLANMSATPDMVKNSMIVTSVDTSNFKHTLSSASYVVSECEGFVMKTMCMGESCNPAGFTMNLDYSIEARQQPSELKVKLTDLLHKK